MKTALLLLLAMTLGMGLVWTGETHAETLPQPTVQQMCEETELVLEGEWQGGDRMTITRVWQSSRELARDAKELKVSELPDLLRRSGFLHLGESKEITTKKLFVFLTFDKAKREWRLLHKYREGSPGVIWWDATQCYYYWQAKYGYYNLWAVEVVNGWGREGNPKGVDGTRHIPLNAEEVRLSIEKGVAARAKFEATLATADLEKRAAGLMAYLPPLSTDMRYSSPIRIRAFRELLRLNKVSVPALVGAVRASKTPEDIRLLMEGLEWIGPDAGGAKALVREIVESESGKDHPAIDRAITILVNIGDRESATRIRPYLRRASTRRAAVEALAAFDDKESFDAIAEVLPEVISGKNCDEVLTTLRALYKLDSARAVPLARKASAEPVLAGYEGNVMQSLNYSFDRPPRDWRRWQQ